MFDLVNRMNIAKANTYTGALLFCGATLLYIVSIISEFIFGSADYGGAEVQGAAILVFASIGVGVIALPGFSFSYFVAKNIGLSSYYFFAAILSLIVLFISLMVAILLGLIGFGFELSGFIRLVMIEFLILLFGCIPLSIFWWWVAKK